MFLHTPKNRSFNVKNITDSYPGASRWLEAASTPPVETGVKHNNVGVCRGHVTWVFSTALWNWVSKHLCLGGSIPMTVDTQYGIETSILSFPLAAHNGFETLYSGLDMRMRRRVLHGRSKHALVSLHYTQIIVHVCKSSCRYIVLVRNT